MLSIDRADAFLQLFVANAVTGIRDMHSRAAAERVGNDHSRL